MANDGKTVRLPIMVFELAKPGIPFFRVNAWVWDW